MARMSLSSRSMMSVTVAVVLAGAAVASCEFSPGLPGSATGPGQPGQPGTTTTSNPFGGGTGTTGSGGTGTGTPPSLDGRNCGLQQYGLQNVPPDLLIILDKSGSMSNDAMDQPCGAGCQSKWSSMTDGINMVVAQTDTTIRWGLKFFSDDKACGVNAGPAVPIAAGNAPAIATAIMATMPGGNTPTAAAVTSGAAYLQGLTDTNPKYILLATDGEPNCAAAGGGGGRRAGRGGGTTSDAPGAEAAVTMAAAAGIPVFVVGVGNVTAAQMTLDQLATNGGRAQATQPFYYPASNTADLVAVLTKIGGQITSCTFSLGKAPPDPTNIAVYAYAGTTSTRLAQSMTNGWEYGAGMTSIELFGAACDAVKAKTTTDVQAIFGCPGLIIP
jgi:von Willebrand factor type A domain